MYINVVGTLISRGVFPFDSDGYFFRANVEYIGDFGDSVYQWFDANLIKLGECYLHIGSNHQAQRLLEVLPPHERDQKVELIEHFMSEGMFSYCLYGGGENSMRIYAGMGDKWDDVKKDLGDLLSRNRLRVRVSILVTPSDSFTKEQFLKGSPFRIEIESIDFLTDGQG